MKASKLLTESSLPYGYYYGNEADQYTFYRLPKALFTNERYKKLSDGAKILYGLMLDRMGLSTKNGWFDEHNRVYIIFTLENVQEYMNCKHEKAVKLLAELDTNKGVGLIERVRRGQGKPSIIYVRKFFDISEVKTSENQKSGLPDLPKSRVPKTGSQEFRESETNNKDFRDTDMSKIDISPSVSHNRTRVNFDRQTDDEISDLEEIIKRCELWIFSDETAKVFENAIERLYFSENYRICNCILPQQKVRSHLRELDACRLQDAEHKISQNTNRKIKNTTAYVMAVIFNSIWESESDLMCDPYLNSIRTLPIASGGG